MKIINYRPPATIEDFIQFYLPGELFSAWAVGPYGCLAGDTLVVTESGTVPISDIVRPTRVLSWNERTCQYQLSWCGPAFLKGKDYLYRVVTLQGEFAAAEQHRLLCADGVYRRVGDLRAGDALAAYSDTPLQTTAELVQSESRVGAHCSTRTGVGYLARCGESGGLYDRLLRWGLGTAPVTVLAQGGARVCEEYSFLAADVRVDGRWGRKLLRSLRDLFYAPPRTPRYARQSENREEVEVNLGEAEFFARVLGQGRAAVRSQPNWYQNLQAQTRRSLRQWISASSAFLAPKGRLSTTNRPIISITREQKQEVYWDVQVSDTHNYVTVDGAIHHNSGKTTGLFFKLVYMAMQQAPSPQDGIRRTRAVVVRNTAPQLSDTTLKSWNYWV